jgi:putative oxidoreductase
VKSGRGRTVASWVLAVLLALAFLGAGCSKVAGAPAMIEVFEKVGLGQWFRILTGTLEVLGEVGLMVPRLRFSAAVLLALVMVGAVGAHLTTLGGSPIPAVVLLVMAAAAAWLARPTRA